MVDYFAMITELEALPPLELTRACMREQHIGFLAAFAATVIWSGNFILARAIADDISPVQLNFWRWALATVGILPFTLKAMYREWSNVWQHKVYIVCMALTGVSLMNALIYKAGQSTSSINMALLMPSVPIYIMLLSRILYGEPITFRRFFGMIIVILGIVSIIFKGDIANLLAVQFNVGDLWVIGATISFAIYSFYVRQRPVSISLATFNGFTFLIGTLIMLPIVLFEYIRYGIPAFNQEVFISIAYAGIGCSLLAFVLWVKAINILGPVKAGFTYYSIPLFTALAAIWILDEHITFAHIFGGACIVTGILLATIDPKPKLPLETASR